MDCFNCTTAVYDDTTTPAFDDGAMYCDDCVNGAYIVQCEHCELAGLREEHFTLCGNECHSCVAEIDAEMAADDLLLASNDGTNQIVPISDAQNDYIADSARLWAAERKLPR